MEDRPQITQVEKTLKIRSIIKYGSVGIAKAQLMVNMVTKVRGIEQKQNANRRK
ncbi:hypothetical protein ACIGHG_21955 [Bacillus sp. NPDC077411]|uniref:hypothetical protein n=1 Tax=Bacillus sp. NPDC077411 TaxID=3363947 RepID=UPI0037C6767B